MGVPENFKGKKGRSGRKSIKKEKEQLIWVLDRWINPKSVQVILSKRAKGKALSLRETYVLRAAMGSDKVLIDLAGKILPDKLDMTTDGEQMQGVVFLPMGEETGE